MATKLEMTKSERVEVAHAAIDNLDTITVESRKVARVRFLTNMIQVDMQDGTTVAFRTEYALTMDENGKVTH